MMMAETKEAIRTDAAPQAVGPYSQGIESGELVFVSGQLPIDPATGAFPDGDIQARTGQVIRNVEAVLRKSGCSLDHVVKTTVFLVDMGDFQAMNEVYAEHFQQPYPARSVFQVGALPKGADVEMEAIARRA
jgi:2-iminobutanoate/2-iminopropanoate deaminase